MSPKNLVRLAPVLFLSTLIAGCSWITDFVISNTTSADLFVSYAVSGNRCPDDNFIPMPALKTNAELNNSDVAWKTLTLNDYSCDANTRIVKTTLLPNMALRVMRKATYTGPDHYGSEDFKFLHLELKGVEGEIRLNGLMVLKAFKFESRTLFVLNY